MFDTVLNTPLSWVSCWRWWVFFRELVTAKVNVGDQFLRKSAEYLQLPGNRFSTLFPRHLDSMMCLMSTKMALGSAVNSF